MRTSSGLILAAMRDTILPYSFSTRVIFVAWLAILSTSCTPAAKSVNTAASDPLVEGGRKLVVEKTCTTCHSLNGQPGVGPTFVKLFGRKEKLTDGTEVLVDDAYIKESILNPAAKIVARHTPSMPVIPLTDSELEQILALIKSLK